MNIKEAKKRGAKIIRRTVEYVAIMPDGTHFVIMPETHYEFLDFKRKTENEQLRKERDELAKDILYIADHGRNLEIFDKAKRIIENGNA